MKTDTTDDVTSTIESVKRYTSFLCKTLQGNIIGVHLYGSLAWGCFRKLKSDIDLLVVTRWGLNASHAAEICLINQRHNLDLDMTFVKLHDLNCECFPAPFDMFIKPGGRIYKSADGSKDVLLQRQEVYQLEMKLYESEKHEIKPVPWYLIRQCVESVFPHIRTHFKDPILMMCKVLYTLEEKLLTSKLHAGHWALEKLPENWHVPIRKSLASYKGDEEEQCNPDELLAFERYCRQIIVKIGNNE